MDARQILNQLKRKHDSHSKNMDISNVEEQIIQIKNNLRTNDEQLVKTLSDIEASKSKISELSKLLQEVDSKNTRISSEIASLEDDLMGKERENWKQKQNSEGGKQRMEVLNEENKVLMSNFIGQEEENSKLKKELFELKNELCSVSEFVDKFLGIDRNLCKMVGEAQKQQNDLKEMHSSIINKERCEKYHKEIGTIMKSYENKLKSSIDEKMGNLSEIENLKTEYDILKNSIESDSDEKFDLVSELVADQCRKNHVIFRENLEDQGSRLKRLTEMLKQETDSNTKLRKLLEIRMKGNGELKVVGEDMPVRVKDEIVLSGSLGDYEDRQ